MLRAAEAVAQRCSVKKVFLEISQKFKGKHPCQSLFATLLKNRLAHVFSYGFCEIPKNTFSYRTRLVVGSADDFFGLHKNMNCAFLLK